MTIFPDGGIKRIRVLGRRANTESAPIFGNLENLEAISSRAMPEDGHREQMNLFALHGRTITALPLTQEAFVEFGSVIQAYSDINAAPREVIISEANQGSAVKYTHKSARVKASFPAGQPPAAWFAVYRAQPSPPSSTFTVRILERHPHNNQAFFAIGTNAKLWENDLDSSSNRYLVIVAKNGADDRPDLSTLRAFLASTAQGVLYDTGTWHHPLIALDTAQDFACVETQVGGGSKLDCDLVELEAPYVEVNISAF